MSAKLSLWLRCRSHLAHLRESICQSRIANLCFRQRLHSCPLIRRGSFRSRSRSRQRLANTSLQPPHRQLVAANSSREIEQAVLVVQTATIHPPPRLPVRFHWPTFNIQLSTLNAQ